MADMDMGDVSDGYHTFNELYDHRSHLFIALIRCNPWISWRAKYHEDGTMYPRFFVAGMELPTGQITYHIPLWMWSMLDDIGVRTYDEAPDWDGHTSKDVVIRLEEWFKLPM